MAKVWQCFKDVLEIQNVSTRIQDKNSQVLSTPVAFNHFHATTQSINQSINHEALSVRSFKANEQSVMGSAG